MRKKQVKGWTWRKATQPVSCECEFVYDIFVTFRVTRPDKNAHTHTLPRGPWWLWSLLQCTTLSGWQLLLTNQTCLCFRWLSCSPQASLLSNIMHSVLETQIVSIKHFSSASRQIDKYKNMSIFTAEARMFVVSLFYSKSLCCLLQMDFCRDWSIELNGIQMNYGGRSPVIME